MVTTPQPAGRNKRPTKSGDTNVYYQFSKMLV